MARTKTNPAETKAIVSWQDELAADAKAIAATEKPSGGNFVSFKGGKITYKGQEIPGGAVDVIVLDHIMENHLFDGDFDPNRPASPICYAFGREDSEMHSHEDSANPQDKAAGCAGCTGCPANEWGSGRGKGKACKNVRRLACIMAEDLGDLAAAEVFYMKIPVTSVKAWGGYVNALNAQLGRPPYAAITRVVCEKTETAFALRFEYVPETDERIADAKTIKALKEKRALVMEQIAFPYPKVEEAPAPAKGKGAKFQASGVTAKAGKFVPKGH